MRKLTYFAMASVDGFIETPSRSLDWVVVDEEVHTYVNDQQRELGGWLYGRRMYELMARDWPVADSDPSTPEYIKEFAELWRRMPKVVFSKTLEHVEWNARLVRGDAIEEVARLKAKPGKDLSVGGSELAGALARAGLIDEYQICVNPVILGAGTPVFGRLDKRIGLQLVETRRFTSGVVALVYRKRE
jgi:dihydrofolate reductase